MVMTVWMSVSHGLGRRAAGRIGKTASCIGKNHGQFGACMLEKRVKGERDIVVGEYINSPACC